MDSCGEYLQVASRLAKRRFGNRATVGVSERGSTFPADVRWVARAWLRDEVVAEGAATCPEDAARRLGEDLAEPMTRQVANDRALLDGAARAGIGA